MRNTSKALPLLALLACVLFAAEARADTFVVTGGVATSGGVSGGTFTLTGNGFALSGGFYQGPNSCFPCRPGQTISLGSFNSGLDIVRGSASTFQGITYERLYYSIGFMQFSASVVMPNVTDSLFTITTPFTFTAMLQGCTDPLGPITYCKPGDIVFNANFVGQGLAIAEFNAVDDARGGRLYSIRRIRYEFAPASTPEPATVALLASGLAGVGAVARRRRRKAAPDKSP